MYIYIILLQSYFVNTLNIIFSYNVASIPYTSLQNDKKSKGRAKIVQQTSSQPQSENSWIYPSLAKVESFPIGVLKLFPRFQFELFEGMILTNIF